MTLDPSDHFLATNFDNVFSVFITAVLDTRQRSNVRRRAPRVASLPLPEPYGVHLPAGSRHAR